jgi:hypothetical protein
MTENDVVGPPSLSDHHDDDAEIRSTPDGPQTVNSLEAKNNGVDKKKKTKEKDPMTNFTSDAPYFHAYCDSEISTFMTMADTLRDISTRTKTLCQASNLQAEAALRLAKSCRLRQEKINRRDNSNGLVEDDDGEIDPEALYQRRKDALGHEMTMILQYIGAVSAIPSERA